MQPQQEKENMTKQVLVWKEMGRMAIMCAKNNQLWGAQVDEQIFRPKESS
jgi:hypothetical protein